MHTGPVPGTFTTGWMPVVVQSCHKCGGALEYRKWESDCGGYDDQQFRCTSCGQSWWIESSDS